MTAFAGLASGFAHMARSLYDQVVLSVTLPTSLLPTGAAQEVESVASQPLFADPAAPSVHDLPMAGNDLLQMAIEEPYQWILPPGYGFVREDGITPWDGITPLD